MLGKLEPHEIEALLRRNQIGRLGIYGRGEVYIFPIAYGYDGRFLYAQSAEGLKLELMRARPEVGFEVEEIIGPSRWRTVMLHGMFEELTETDDRDRAFALIAAQGQEVAPPSLAPYVHGPGEIVAYRIHIGEVTGRFEEDLPLILRVNAAEAAP